MGSGNGEKDLLVQIRRQSSPLHMRSGCLGGMRLCAETD